MHKNSKSKTRTFRLTVHVAVLAMVLVTIAGLMTSCGGGSDDVSSTQAGTAFSNTDVTDLSDYDSMADYDGDSRLIETDVAEAVQLIKDKESFVLFFSYADCPYCNRIMPYVNEAAENAGQFVGYINTRKDPSWTSNMDIDGYDQVVKYFGDYLEEDDNGAKHLYTPDMYFIKNGRIVARHEGVTPGADDPDVPLTSAQEEELMKTLAEEFASME